MQDLICGRIAAGENYNLTRDSMTDEVKMFLEKMVILAKKTDTVLELNESSLVTNEAGGYERILYWLSLAKENGNVISLGTEIGRAHV